MRPAIRLIAALTLMAAPAAAEATREMAGDPAADQSASQSATADQAYPDVNSSSVTTRPASEVQPVPPSWHDQGGAGATSGTAAGAGSVDADQVRGTVDSVDPTRRKVTIRDDQGNLVSYDLAAGANIRVGARDASLSALSNGDPVSIEVSDADPTRATAVRLNTGQ